MLGKLSLPGRPTYLDNSRQGPIALGVGMGGVLGHFFLLVYLFSILSSSVGDGLI